MNVKVPFNELLPRSPLGREETLAAVRSVVDSGQFFFGPETRSFETEFADFVGVSHAIGVANGTDALEIALRALEVGSGDSVLCVANAGGYGSIAVQQVGATPHYVDTDPHSLQMLPESLELAIASAPRKPKSVIVTHLYGAIGQIEEIVAICRRHQIFVLEDCAQAIGVLKNGIHAGKFGDIATFSFYPTKNLGGIGDGGLVATDSGGLAATVRSLAQYGWGSKYSADLAFGRNSRLDELQAAVLRKRLKRIDSVNSSRLDIYQRYLSAAPSLDFAQRGQKSFNGHLAVLQVPQRKVFQEFFHQLGVQTAIHYPLPDSWQPGFLGTSNGIPSSEASCARVVSVPCHEGLDERQVDLVSRSLEKFEALQSASSDD